MLKRVFSAIVKPTKGREQEHKLGQRYKVGGFNRVFVSEHERKIVEQKNKDADAYDRAYDEFLNAKNSIRNTSGKEREAAEKRVEEARKNLDKIRGDFKTRWTSNR